MPQKEKIIVTYDPNAEFAAQQTGGYKAYLASRPGIHDVAQDRAGALAKLLISLVAWSMYGQESDYDIEYQ